MSDIEKMRIRRNIIAFTIVILLIVLGINIYEDSLVKEKIDNISNYDTEKETIQQDIEKQDKTKKKVYPKTKVATTYKGYKVAAKLEIPNINLETYILKDYNEKALKVSVTKFYGVNANEIGNFCVAGHNYIRKNMFRNLKRLKLGDKIYVSDNKIGKVEYKIYQIYKVKPDDVSCLSQDTNNKREVTLITCTNDSKKRVIVKAKEI